MSTQYPELTTELQLLQERRRKLEEELLKIKIRQLFGQRQEHDNSRYHQIEDLLVER